ncbi:MAG: type II secretion system F family protein [Candidatus Paceibacterota bacterium]
MRFVYTAIDESGEEQKGHIETYGKDAAISQLQQRGLTILEIGEEGENVPIWERRIKFFERVSNKEVVIISRQFATLFQADVSALKVFTLLGNAAENQMLKDALFDMVDQLKEGNSISKAFSKHTDIFSDFYVNMVAAGEESGNLADTFAYLADYMDRNYELTSSVKSALVYPAFVITTFVAVMILMLTTVIPNITEIIVDSGQEPPIYTKIVIGMSDFLLAYGIYLLFGLLIGGYGIYWYVTETDEGEEILADIKLQLPYLGNLYQKLYLSRLCDNMHTMLRSGIPMTRAIEITASVIDNRIYHEMLMTAVDDIKGGRSIADSLSGNDQIPGIMVQMMQIGEETGELGNILKTLSNFYRREVKNAVDGLVSLIEPIMILMLGVGVGGLLASVLMPIYNLSAGF